MQDQRQRLRVATYNVHRWGGRTGRTLVPAHAAHVIRELNADILALQEVLLPWGETNPLARLAAALDMHVIFGATRLHRHGLLSMVREVAGLAWLAPGALLAWLLLRVVAG